MARLPGTRSARLLVILAIQLADCARYQHFQPAPISVADETRAYNARRLDDPALTRVLAAQGVPVNDTAWNFSQLAIAALYFRPDITEAERTLAAARAGEITAGARPYPGIAVTTDRAAHVSGGQSTPWSLSLAAGLTFERGGKRNARLARANAVTFASRLRLESTAWKAVESVKRGGVRALAAEMDLADARRETSALRSLLALFRARYAEGQIARAELARSEADLRAAGIDETRAMRARTEARIALAHALAVPLHQVSQLPLSSDSRSGCRAVDSLPIDTLQTLALRTLPVAGAALGDYTVADADLRLAIAQQYPDIVLGPGLGWDKGVQRWILSLALPRIPVDRARGPIAEATARRAVQAARVRVVQDSVLAAVDSASATCRSSRRDILAADSLLNTTEEQFALARAAYGRGEIGMTEVALAKLSFERARRTHDQATQRILLSGVTLEEATGLWLLGPPIQWQGILIGGDSLGTPPPAPKNPRQ